MNAFREIPTRDGGVVKVSGDLVRIDRRWNAMDNDFDAILTFSTGQVVESSWRYAKADELWMAPILAEHAERLRFQLEVRQRIHDMEYPSGRAL